MGVGACAGEEGGIVNLLVFLTVVSTSFLDLATALSSDNKKILLTTRNVRLDSGCYATKYYYYSIAYAGG